MTVYVDRLSYAIPKSSQAKRCGDLWCHLWADTTNELIIFSQKIGLKGTWIRDKPGFVHFDLTPKKREEAIKAGALEMSLKKWLKQRTGYM